MQRSIWFLVFLLVACVLQFGISAMAEMRIVERDNANLRKKNAGLREEIEKMQKDADEKELFFQDLLHALQVRESNLLVREKVLMRKWQELHGQLKH